MCCLHFFCLFTHFEVAKLQFFGEKERICELIFEKNATKTIFFKKNNYSFVEMSYICGKKLTKHQPNKPLKT